MHDQGICHRDLKTENILLDSNYNLIIADFGYGSNQELNSTAVGTISYMAPEVFEGRPYIGKVVDIFGIGIILFMMKKIKPFQKADVFDPIYSNMINQEQHKFWEIHSSQNEAEFSEEYKDLINQLLAYQPTHRLSISEIKQHPWYNGPM
jgi:serine/threonine protein kinase